MNMGEYDEIPLPHGMGDYPGEPHLSTWALKWMLSLDGHRKSERLLVCATAAFDEEEGESSEALPACKLGIWLPGTGFCQQLKWSHGILLSETGQ
jgi:hypothetical protein